MKKQIIVTTLIIMIMPLENILAQVEEDMSFEEYKQKEQENYAQYKKETTEAYEEYYRKYEEGIKKLKEEVETYWGNNNFKISTNKKWVEYSKDKDQRSEVDFETGNAKMEVLVTPEEADDENIIKKKIKEAVENLVTSEGETTYVEDEKEKPQEIMDEPVLKGQLQNSKGENVEKENAEKFAEEIAEESEVIKEEVEGTDGKKRINISVNLPLAPEHIKVRANKFKHHIKAYASRFDLPPELVYAIIHTESYFNPKARSWVPAFGLMQIVPKYAGRDAYNYLYKRDNLLTSSYLYQPDKNIEIGTAYFKLLLNRDFKKVKNKDCRILCAIAAYNTGAGNVSKTFTGNTNLNKAISKINTYSYNDLFSYLKQNLPFKETRDYIVRVNNRMKKYKGWAGH